MNSPSMPDTAVPGAGLPFRDPGLPVVDADRVGADAVTPADPSRSATLLFRCADLTGAARIDAEVAREDGAAELGRLAVPVTGGRHTWTTAGAALSAVAHGKHDLTLVLRGAFRLTAFRFGSSRAAD